MKKPRTLKIVNVSPSGRDAVLLSLNAGGSETQNFQFVPGQYLTLAATVDGNEHWRCYSITSEPRADEPISVLVRRVSGGVVSNWICDNAKTGGEIRVLPPAGRFTLARLNRPLLLFAGGSGIAPIYALARQALVEGVPKVSLFYANRDRGTIMLVEELKVLEKDFKDRFQIKFWIDQEEGLPTVEVLRSAADKFGDADVYLCGPEMFMQAIQATLQQAGFDPDRMYREDFGNLAEHAEPSADADQEALMAVEFKGGLRHVAVKEGQSLLSAMLASGLPAPHSCRVGECASCMCRLIEGEVERLENSVLDKDDEAEGWILAFFTPAMSKKLRVRFS